MQFLLEKWIFFVVKWICCSLDVYSSNSYSLFETYFSNFRIVKSNSNRHKKVFVAFLIGNSVNMKLKSFLSVKVA